MFSIAQVSEADWEVLDAARVRIGDMHVSYPEALAFIGGMLAVAVAPQDESDEDESDGEDSMGLLAERWVDVEGIAFAEATGDGRDFTGVVWTARDPAVSTLPLMLQTSTDVGHFGAELAGFIDEIGGLGEGTTPTAAGVFYDSEAGRQFRDMLGDGRRFGVSVDPGAVSVEWVCVAEDDDGFCVQESAVFTGYEIVGLTGTPFPAFGRAAIQLVPVEMQAAAGAPSALGSGGTAAAIATRPAPARTRTRTATVDLAHPPAGWFATPEPAFGERFALGSLGDEWLIDQGGGRVAMPHTITDDGRVLGHLAVWGQRHVAYPAMTVTPPHSPAAYRHFHVGEVVCADGSSVATGALTASSDHALSHLRAPEANDVYAHNGRAWANVRIVDGVHGPWVSGALRADVTADQVAVLRAGGWSGDWRLIDGALELIAALAVTTPGFPVAREALVASGWTIPPASHVRASVVGGVQVSLVGAGMVRRCPECARRAAATVDTVDTDGSPVWATLETSGPPAELTAALGLLRVLERRTRHLIDAERERVAGRIHV